MSEKIYGIPVATPFKATPASHAENKNNPHGVTAAQVGARPDTWMPTAEDVGARSNTWMPSASDVGARPATWTPSASEVGATPASHTENKNNPHGVTAEQVGARPNDWIPSAEEVGARPNTWTPTASDVGARPDNWMPTAEQVGARANTWLPTIAEIGAAPSGYGLGEYAPFITDANEAILPGFYRFDSSKTCANVPSEWQFPYGTMIVSRGSSYIEQLFLAREINAKRTCSGNTWGEWEYINPPMAVGVEYRTTERYNGKPVYAKLINFGTLPNNTGKDVLFGDDSSRPISVTAQVGKELDSLYLTIPSNYPAADMRISAVNYKYIRINTGQNNSDLQARVIVKYWKSTD